MKSSKDGLVSGDLSPELVPVVEPGALALAFRQPAQAGDETALGDLLSDALFGEVIDISDLISRVLLFPAEVALHPDADTSGTGFGGQDAGDFAAAASDGAAVLTILYDDDILTSGGSVL
jgi:hypothetical protein